MAETLFFEGIKGRSLHLWLFIDVTNSSDLLRQVQNHSLEPECSLINAELVADPWLIKAAAFKALADEQRGRLKTYSLHGELVFNLSGSRHVRHHLSNADLSAIAYRSAASLSYLPSLQIGEAFKQYGLAENVRNVIVGRFDATEEQEERILSMVDGKLKAFSSLQEYTDSDRIQKVVTISPAEQALGDLTGSIITRMATRDC